MTGHAPVRATLLAVGWTTLMLVMLWSPPPEGPSPMGSIDKVVHALLFCGFAMAWLRAKPHRLGWIALAGLALAPITELTQGVLPWPREPEVADVLADLAGLLLGLVAMRRPQHGKLSNARRDARADLRPDVGSGPRSAVATETRPTTPPDGH